MRDLFDHNVVNLADYIVWNDRINKLGIIISVKGDVCEIISRSYCGIFIERLGKNLRKPQADNQ
jgi:hypothetical protein